MLQRRELAVHCRGPEFAAPGRFERLDALPRDRRERDVTEKVEDMADEVALLLVCRRLVVLLATREVFLEERPQLNVADDADAVGALQRPADLLFRDGFGFGLRRRP